MERQTIAVIGVSFVLSFVGAVTFVLLKIGGVL